MNKTFDKLQVFLVNYPLLHIRQYIPLCHRSFNRKPVLTGGLFTAPL
nr:MAG TPA: hypothetical protein [Caudoviricetes sp.]